MRRNLRQRGQAWLIAIAVVFFTFAAGAQDDGSAAADAGPIAESSGPLSSDPVDRFHDDFGEYEVAAVNAADDPRAGIETITVTAQKRTQRLQEVPAAVSAISGQQLDAVGITQVQDVQVLVPNMHFGQERGEAKITIRGVSNAHRTDPSTAIHLDGIYQNRARPITSLTFFDIQRVEVLRGPQGTLYGRNATGGAMNIISTPPGPEFEAFGDIQFGNFPTGYPRKWNGVFSKTHQKMARGALNAPILEDLAALRVSGFWEDRDGYQQNFALEGRDDDADDADDFGIRAQLLLTPGGSLDATLRFNYARKRGVGFALKRDGPLPEFIEFGPDLPPPFNRQPIYAGATENPEDERKVYLDTKGRIDNEMINGNADIQWRVPEMPFVGNTKLRILGSLTEFDDLSVNDQDYSDLLLTVANESWKGDEWVGEIDWSSDYGGNGGWLLGIFHLGTTIDNDIDAPATIPLYPEHDPNEPLPPPIEIPVPFFQEFESSAYSLAGFVNGWYRITDKLRIEAGARYGHDWKKSHLESPPIDFADTEVPLFVAIDDQRSGDWGEPTGSISLDYQITDDSLAYGRFATGYKAGTVNNDIAVILGELTDPDCKDDDDGTACDGIFSPGDAEPEYLYALEAGLKNTLFDNRGLVNGTAFIYWYTDLQVSQFRENQYFVENAATARIWGIELESTWRPIEPLTLEAQFSYLDTTYTDYEDCRDAKDLSKQDCTGKELSRAPRFSGNLIATYEIDLGRFGSVTPLAQLYASDEVFFRPTNEAADTQDAYYLLGFRLMWRSVDDHLGLDLFIDNALDEDVATTKIVGSSLLGSPLLDAYDRPRTVGARVSLAW
jgi:iron complex outermembrane receptor protein